jgi:predicted dehydrogenase
LERAEYCPAQADAAWEIIGSEGALTLHMLTQESKSIVFHEATADKGTVSRVIWQGNDDGSATKAGPVRDFAQAIGEGREPLTPLERALVVQEITDAIYASAEKGVAIDLP